MEMPQSYLSPSPCCGTKPWGFCLSIPDSHGLLFIFTIMFSLDLHDLCISRSLCLHSRPSKSIFHTTPGVIFSKDNSEVVISSRKTFDVSFMWRMGNSMNFEDR